MLNAKFAFCFRITIKIGPEYKENARVRWNAVLKCRNITDSAFGLENKPDNTVKELAFQYVIHLWDYLKR